jgi:hypothetical protein
LLNLAAFLDLARTNQLDHARHHRDEFLVVFAHAAQQLDLVFGHELEPVQIVAELIELAQRGIERALVRRHQRGRDAVELTRGVVLKLTIRADLAVKQHQLFGARVDRTQRFQTDGPDHDQQDDDGQERGEELDMDGGRNACYQTRQPLAFAQKSKKERRNPVRRWSRTSGTLRRCMLFDDRRRSSHLAH